MRSKHILIEKAFVYQKGDEKVIDEGYVYDNLRGYWVKKGSDKPAVFEPSFSGPKTKKADVETGEDQKGE